MYLYIVPIVQAASNIHQGVAWLWRTWGEAELQQSCCLHRVAAAELQQQRCSRVASTAQLIAVQSFLLCLWALNPLVTTFNPFNWQNEPTRRSCLSWSFPLSLNWGLASDFSNQKEGNNLFSSFAYNPSWYESFTTMSIFIQFPLSHGSSKVFNWSVPCRHLGIPLGLPMRSHHSKLCHYSSLWSASCHLELQPGSSPSHHHGPSLPWPSS